MARRKTLTLATYNVNGIGTRLPHLLAWLEAEKPDAMARCGRARRAGTAWRYWAAA